MEIDVKPEMLLPLDVDAPVSEPGGSMRVSFQVPTRDWQLNLLISLCIRVTIGGLSISYYRSQVVFADGNNYTFDTLLPVDATIKETKATYVVAYDVR